MRYSKFKIADFKYSKHFVKLQHKNTQIQQSGLKFKVFCFAWNFAFWKFEGDAVKYDRTGFSNPYLKMPK